MRMYYHHIKVLTLAGTNSVLSRVEMISENLFLFSEIKSFVDPTLFGISFSKIVLIIIFTSRTHHLDSLLHQLLLQYHLNCYYFS